MGPRKSFLKKKKIEIEMESWIEAKNTLLLRHIELTEQCYSLVEQVERVAHQHDGHHEDSGHHQEFLKAPLARVHEHLVAQV